MKQRTMRALSLSLLLSLCVTLGLYPGGGATARASDVSTWADLQAAMTTGGSVKLTGDVTAAASDSALNVPSGVTVALDLNGHTIDRALTSNVGSGYVIKLDGTLTIDDTSSGKNGTITGGKNEDSHYNGNGGGVYVSQGATLTLNNGHIKGNYAHHGGGVSVDGALVFNGGFIEENTAGEHGGGIYVNEASFTLCEGAHLMKNTAGEGGGIYSIYDSVITLSGGVISKNIAIGNGGGLSIYGGTNTMTGGSITGNTAANGGGIKLSGTFTMSGGEISGNQAVLSDEGSGGKGGGVHAGAYYGDAHFVMSNGTVSGNTAGSQGGGLYVAYNDGANYASIYGGSITTNAAQSGGGVYVNSDYTKDLTLLSVSGSANITGNTSGGNVCIMPYYDKIAVTDSLNSDARIGITLQGSVKGGAPYVVTSGFSGKGALSNFTLDETYDCDFTLNDDGEAQFFKEHIHTYIDANGQEQTCTPVEWTASGLPSSAGSYSVSSSYLEPSGTWVVPQGITNLCLNGNTIYWDGSDGVIIRVPTGATLNIFDEGGNGRIYYGALGVEVDGGEFNLYDGKITDNKTGVTVKSGIFNMRGGMITGAKGNQVTVGASGPAQNCGGVAVLGGAFYMTGGKITGNKGCGVLLANSASPLHVSGDSRIIWNGEKYLGYDENYNKQYDGCNVVMYDAEGTDASAVIDSSKPAVVVDGALTSGDNGAKFGITYLKYTATGTCRCAVGVFTSGLSGKGSVSNFTSDNELCEISLDSGEAKLAMPAIPYQYYTLDNATAVLHTDGSCEAYTVVTSSKTAWDAGWYVVNADTAITNRVNVTGDVHLILMDGKTLTASAGINVAEGNSLTIYAQSEGDSMGKLTATGGSMQAGIGGGENENGGAITINGGAVTANGGDPGAGIGGGYEGNGGTTIINGGAVTANGGQYGAGIGGGYNSVNGGAITVNGGAVMAQGGECSAGIGGGGYNSGSGNASAGGEITINGGVVTATGSDDGAGIGGGYNNVKGGAGGTITISGGNVTATGGINGSAGIGGGRKGAGGAITISGGKVTATGGARNATSDGGAGIGGGYAGAGGEITVSGGTVTATGGNGSSAGIGGGQSGANGTLTVSSGLIVQASGTDGVLQILASPYDTRPLTMIVSAGEGDYTIFFRDNGWLAPVCVYKDASGAPNGNGNGEYMTNDGDYWRLSASKMPVSVQFIEKQPGQSGQTGEQAVSAVYTAANGVQTNENFFVMLGEGEIVTVYGAPETGNDENAKKYVLLNKGGTLTKPANPAVPTDAGYIFKQWERNGYAYRNQAYDFSTPVTECFTLSATYQDKSYTVTFDSGVAAQTVTHGAKAAKPSNPSSGVATKVFQKWALAENLRWIDTDGSLKIQGAGTEYNFNQPVKSDVKLKAQWAHKHVYSAQTLKAYLGNWYESGFDSLNETQHVSTCAGCNDYKLEAHSFAKGKCSKCQMTQPVTEYALRVYVDGGLLKTQTVKKGVTVGFYAPSLSGKRFLKWQIAARGSSSKQDVSTSTYLSFTLGSNADLYAVYGAEPDVKARLDLIPSWYNSSHTHAKIQIKWQLPKNAYIYSVGILTATNRGLQKVSYITWNDYNGKVDMKNLLKDRQDLSFYEKKNQADVRYRMLNNQGYDGGYWKGGYHYTRPTTIYQFNVPNPARSGSYSVLHQLLSGATANYYGPWVYAMGYLAYVQNNQAKYIYTNPIAISSSYMPQSTWSVNQNGDLS